MSEQGTGRDAAVTAAMATVVTGVSSEDRHVNTAANLANAVTGIYGLSGSGKSSLADTAVEYAYETFGKISLAYVMDLGGFGTKRLSLVRGGILRIYDPSNHVNPFETMELISLGAWPLTLIDPERGFAAPDVPLILPRRVLHVLYCPQGHVVRREANPVVFQTSITACPTCGVNTNLSNALKVDKQITRHKMFGDVGLRIYDSFTAMNDWGLSDLQEQSARGTLPVNASGGSALAGADALRSGQFRFSTGSQAQVGFVQNRTYAWLKNIRTIPDQVVPAIATFLVETGKASDESGGLMVLGPKIAGTARTAASAGWVGNLLHATKEPNDAGVMVHRLWLTTHTDPQDPRHVPYLAKHRGTPLGMPDYLEDVVGTAPWSTCSLKVFFRKLDDQLKALEAERMTAYPQAPGIWRGAALEEEDVIGDVVAGAAAAAGGSTSMAGVPPTSLAQTGGQPQATVQSGGVRRLRGRPSTPMANAPSATPSPASIVPMATGPTAAVVPAMTVPSTSAASAQVGAAAEATPAAPAAVVAGPATMSTSASSAVAMGAGVGGGAMTPPTPAPLPTTPTSTSPIRRRIARPPVG